MWLICDLVNSLFPSALPTPLPTSWRRLVTQQQTVCIVSTRAHSANHRPTGLCHHSYCVDNGTPSTLKHRPIRPLMNYWCYRLPPPPTPPPLISLNNFHDPPPSIHLFYMVAPLAGQMFCSLWIRMQMELQEPASQDTEPSVVPWKYDL